MEEEAKVGISTTMLVLATQILVSSIVLTADITSADLVTGSTINITTTSTSAINQATGDATNTKYLEVTNHSLSEDLLFTIVNGTVVNNSNSTVNSVEINVQFYDENGTLITTNSETARSVILGPGENSSFDVKTDLGDETIHNYKVIPGGDIEAG